MFGWRRNLTEADRSKHWSESLVELETFENSLGTEKDFFSGKQGPGWLDFMIWPWMERIEAFAEVYGECRLPSHLFPNLVSWSRKMEKNSSVSDYYLPTNTHAQFIKSVQTGNPDYNLLLKWINKYLNWKRKKLWRLTSCLFGLIREDLSAFVLYDWSTVELQSFRLIYKNYSFVLTDHCWWKWKLNKCETLVYQLWSTPPLLQR